MTTDRELEQRTAPGTPSEPPAGLRVRGLSVAYGALRVLSGVDLDLGPGEHVAILGSSGTGKSTLLRAVAGLILPQEGSIAFGGEPWSAGAQLLVQPEQRRIGMLAQHPALWPHMSVERHLVQVLRWRGASAAEARERTAEMLRRLGLEDLRRRRPAQISGGQAQRVALARALVAGARLLLLDEPLTYLDPRARRELGALIKELARDAGAAILHVTHEPREAEEHADRVAVVGEGRLLGIGTPSEMAGEVHRRVLGLD